MPTSDKKRSPDAPLSADTKRQRVLTSISVATPSSTNVFEISVFMKDEFDVFPERLRETIQEQLEVLVTRLVRRYERGLPLKPKPDFEFTIMRKTFSRPGDEITDFQVVRPKRYSDVSLANQAILQEFQTKVPKRQSKITELKLEAREQPMANPALVRRHSVRNGEMGWAFDKFGCISLHVTNPTRGGVRHESIWVERAEPKTVKDPTTVKKDPTSVKKESTADQKKATADKAPSTVSPLMVDLSIDDPPPVNPPPVNPPPVNPTIAGTSTVTAANPTAVKVEKDDDDCYIVDGPKATKGSKWRTVKEPTTIKKKTIVNKKEATAEEKEFKADKRTPMAYKPPTVTDVTDEDDEDGRVIVDSPNAAK